MKLRTYNSIFTVERRLFRWHDWTLPRPLAYKTIFIGVPTYALWWTLLIAVQVPFSARLGVLWLLPPWWAVKKITQALPDGKALHHAAATRLRHGWRLWTVR